ncbi:hypothetical protein Ssed_4505 [Shewanella sediminis HAW-EB3]|uniref:Uncharacterized protein n=2 Tax=Shewanella sediminis TaxID=271097 RepID=A8G1Y4_SHESH|nr:hypothetical protein Ssed_4505 [Shewanella sediminis HAW-EB3]
MFGGMKVTVPSLLLITSGEVCADTSARRCEAIPGRFAVSSLKPKLAAAATPVGKARNAIFELHQTSSTSAFDWQVVYTVLAWIKRFYV